MATGVYLGIDFGAESGRVMAGLFDGSRIEIEELNRFDNGPVLLADSMRWDILKLWRSTLEGLRIAADRFGEDIQSVGVDTWGVDYVLLSKNDELLGHPFHYRDSRNLGTLEAALSRVPRDEIFAATGIQFMEINTLCQLIASQQRTPELLETADRLLMMPDFFHWCLSGSRVVEFTNATTSQCYHPTNRDWSFDLLDKLGIPGNIFPEVVQPGTRLGKLRESVVAESHLPRVEVVAPATHDTGAAIAAVPTRHTGSSNWAYISSGTWSLMGIESPHAILGEDALAANITNEGGIDGTYRVLKNIMGLWLVQRCRADFHAQGKPLGYDELVAHAEQAPPLRAVIDPDHPDFLNPERMTDAIARHCAATGQPVPTSDGEFVRTALESLAMKYRYVLDLLTDLTGTPVEVIHIVGGGCQNRLLNQMTANACGVPVLAGPVEATVLGNVLVQARSMGELSSLSDIRDVVRNSTEPERFDPQDTAAWNDAYGRFREVIGQ